MNKKFNIFKIIYFIVLAIILFGYKDLSNVATRLSYVSCGSATRIPKPIPQLTTTAYTLIVTATPIILIIFSIIVLFKATSLGSADDIEKAKKNLFKKFIIAAIIFFVASIIQFVIQRVTTNKDDTSSATNCIKCFLYYSSSNCPTDTSDEYGYSKRRKTQPTSNYTNSNIVHKSNRTSSNKTTSNTSTSKSSDKVILVGDSRTVGICGYGDSAMHSGEKCRDYVAVAQGGMGATWFKDSAVPAVNIIINGNPNNKYKILILLGANDAGENPGDEANGLSIYKSKLKELATGAWKNHTVIFVKTTSADKAKANSYNMHLSQTQIDSFNSSIKTFINNEKISNLKFCDIEDVPTKYLTDGVHYNADGYNFYYEQVKNKCA